MIQRTGSWIPLTCAIAMGCGDDTSGGDQPVDAGTEDATEGQDAHGDAGVDSRDDGPGDVDAGGTDSPDEGDVPAGPLELDVIANPSNPLAFYVEWETPIAATTSVSFDCDGDTGIIGGDELRESHSVYLQGFVADVQCRITVRSEAGGVAYFGEAEFTPGPLPAALPELDVDSPDGADVAPGWTLFNLTNQTDAIPLMIVMVDSEGRYRWFHRRAGDYPGDATQLEVLDEGILVGGNRTRQRGAIVSWEGELLEEMPFRQHHELRPYLDESEFLYLGSDPDCPETTGHTLGIFDRDAGETRFVWSHCEHFEPVPIYGDWSHLNAAEPFPGEDAILVSSRNTNALYKVDVTAGVLEWMIGSPRGDYEPADLRTFTFADDDDRFYEQHAPELQQDGSILIFDNGRDGIREYSRVVQIAFDEEAGTAEAVWEWHPEDDPIYVEQWGDADRLDNGNVLSAWGARRDGRRSHIIEITPDGDEAWHLRPPPNWGLYRADRLDDVPRGFVHDPDGG